MKRYSASLTTTQHRHALTRIEVIIVACFLSLLMVVVLRYVLSSRETGHRLLCKNHLMNLGLAIHNYATVHGGMVPLLEDGQYGWPTSLLRYTDRNDLVGNVAGNQKWWIKVFTCPDDPNTFRQPGGLSYVANAGYGSFVAKSAGEIQEVGQHSPDIDLDGDGTVDADELAVNRATGVFWRAHPDGFHLTLDAISQADGLGQTVMLTESQNAQQWSSRNTRDIAFVIGREAFQFSNPATSLAYDNIRLDAYRMNSNLGKARGKFPVPSSNHLGTVNFAFCDGGVRALNQMIDPSIYARLMTWQGNHFGQAHLKDTEY